MYVGVTVIVATTGSVPSFTAVTLGKSPVPVADVVGTAVVLLFVHA